MQVAHRDMDNVTKFTTSKCTPKFLVILNAAGKNVTDTKIVLHLPEG